LAGCTLGVISPTARGRKKTQSTNQGVEASSCHCFVRDDLGRRPVPWEDPAFSSGGRCGLDLLLCAVGRKADNLISNPRTGAARVAGHVRIGRRADCNSPSGRRVPRQRGGSISPFADSLGSLITMPFELVPDCAECIISRKTVTKGAMPVRRAYPRARRCRPTS